MTVSLGFALTMLVAAACIPALDAVPPSVLAFDEGAAFSWLHADGAIVMVHRARSRKTATSLKLEASRGR